jgi:hypothetical protein
MKKAFAALLVVGLLVVAAAGPAWAQEKKVTFSLNAGLQTDIFNGSSFDKALFTVDGRVGLRLGRSFELSPEVMVVFRYLSLFDEGSGTILYPGAMLNYRSKNFFVGVGAVLPWAFAMGTSDTGNPAPKVNIGYTFPNGIQLTAYYLTWTESGISLFDIGFAGVTLGYRF